MLKIMCLSVGRIRVKDVKNNLEGLWKFTKCNKVILQLVLKWKLWLILYLMMDCGHWVHCD